MKFIVSIILTGLLSFVAGLYLPWWTIAIASFAVAGLIHQENGKAFLSGFLGIFVMWSLLLWVIDANNKSILSHKIAYIFPLGGSSFLLIVVTSLIGAIVGGLGALSGSYLKKMR